ncbi:MAG: ABC transporter ATP-binding protein [Nitrososphaerota archaeon]
MSAILELRSLSAFYDKAQVLFDVDMMVRRGELVAVLGRNGVGKTTLLKAIMGIEVTKTGKVFFDGHEITNLPTHRIASLGIAYVPDYTGLIPGIKVADNLRLAVGSKRLDLQLAKQVYPQIEELLERRADTLSGGERKIVAVIRALMMRPKLVLLDEPTEGVSPVIASKIYSMLADMKERGMSLLVVEQGTRFSQITQLADRALIMVNGRIVYEGSRDKVLSEIETVRSLIALG